MASDDVYLRKDVYAADQRAIIAEMQRGNAEVLRVLEQFRSENKAAISELRTEFTSKLDENKAAIEQLRSENKEAINQLRTDMNDRFNQVDARIGKLESQVVVLSGRVDGLERRTNSLEVFVTAGIGFIAMLITLLVFIMPISRFMRRLWRPQPTITLEQVEALIDAKLSPKQ